MRRRVDPPVPATAIETCPVVAPTAIAVGQATPRAPASVLDDHLGQIVLADGATARRAGRWLYAVNYGNLAVCLFLFFTTIEIIGPASWPALEVGLTAWLLLDFMPVALVFAGAQRLKHLKGFGLARLGDCCMFYLAVQRAALALFLATLATAFPKSIPMPPIVLLCGAVILLLNAVAAYQVLRVLARPGLRNAFR